MNEWGVSGDDYYTYDSGPTAAEVAAVVANQEKIQKKIEGQDKWIASARRKLESDEKVFQKLYEYVDGLGPTEILRDAKDEIMKILKVEK